MEWVWGCDSVRLTHDMLLVKGGHNRRLNILCSIFSYILRPYIWPYQISLTKSKVTNLQVHLHGGHNVLIGQGLQALSCVCLSSQHALCEFTTRIISQVLSTFQAHLHFSDRPFCKYNWEILLENEKTIYQTLRGILGLVNKKVLNLCGCLALEI